MITFKRGRYLLIVFLLCSTTALAGIKKGPYLLFEGSNSSMAVLWQTDTNETNTIRWGTDTGYGMGQATVGVLSGSDFQHKQVISGLQPGTRYYYQVDGYGSGSFRTAPATTATAVKLLAYGDTRSTPAEHEKVAGRMRAAYAADPAFQTICLQAGDWVYADAETNWTNEWFVSGTTYPQMHAFQAEVPIVGARGNHEGAGTYYKKYFPEPYSGGFYWSFDYGPLHVAVVDQYSSYTAGSAQYNWLAADLAASTRPWKIVLLHEPGWTSAGSHTNNTTVQTVLQPLFKQYGVQLVIGGHNHYYARAVVDNIQHLTLGGGGAPLYTSASGQPNIVKTDQSFHHTEIDINGNTMTFTARRSEGTVIESLNFLAAPNQPPVANAGVDQNVTDNDGNGSQGVTLNGSASSDPDGSISTYVWKEGATQIASGATPAVTLSVGVHTITLTVTDNQGASASATVVVTVSICYAVNAMIPGSCYQTIEAAYLAARSGDIIKAAVMAFAETLNANRAISVTIQGGYAPTFSSVTGSSSIQRLNVSAGTLNSAGMRMR
jgi:Calcineurin-like phosphoesterase/Purple acid Phosphatase, N-terminal domain/PKD domain